MSTGEIDLKTLLASMQPWLDPEPYVFCVVGDDQVSDLKPLATFREDEGLSVVLSESGAKAAGFKNQAQFRRITLTIHSSLEAVGLTAAVSNRLAEAGISANVIAAYHHDHIFVPEERAENALEVLRALSRDIVLPAPQTP